MYYKVRLTMCCTVYYCSAMLRLLSSIVQYIQFGSPKTSLTLCEVHSIILILYKYLIVWYGVPHSGRVVESKINKNMKYDNENEVYSVPATT